jgi:hypothetical protein
MATFAHVTALILVASAWGGMVFFAGVVAPLVFRVLAMPEAGTFIRRLFPIYYLVIGAGCAGAAVCLLWRWPVTAVELILLTIVATGFGVARQFLMPRINRFRDASLAGDAPAERAFSRWHRTSVWLNGVQILIICYVLIRLALLMPAQ